VRTILRASRGTSLFRYKQHPQGLPSQAPRVAGPDLTLRTARPLAAAGPSTRHLLCQARQRAQGALGQRELRLLCHGADHGHLLRGQSGGTMTRGPAKRCLGALNVMPELSHLTATMSPTQHDFAVLV